MAEPVFCVVDVDDDEVVLDEFEDVDVDDVEDADPILAVELLTLVTIKLSSASYEQKPGQP